MNRFLHSVLMAAALALAFMAAPASAQVVTQLPVSVTPNTMKDLGNGPLELRVLGGSVNLFTSQGSGISTAVAASTTMVLTASAAANPPCVGCIISGAGITSGTTVAAFNGTTTITLSAAMTVANNTPVSWGMACPSTPGTLPVILAPTSAADGDLPLYTQARICAWQQFGPGATLLPFAIGAH